MPTPSEALTSHVAVTNHGNGIGSENLGNFIECFADYAKSRVLSVGKLQYALEDDGKQHFEDLTPRQVVDELLDECADGIAYLSMVAVKALAIRSALPEGS